jgi:hypothetical protein
MPKMLGVLITLVLIIPAVYFVNLLPISNHQKNIGGIFVGIFLAVIAVVLLKQYLMF